MNALEKLGYSKQTQGVYAGGWGNFIQIKSCVKAFIVDANGKEKPMWLEKDELKAILEIMESER